MNHTEAKFLLRACRPDGQDAQDPALRPALEAAANDPALQAWWERERALDRAIAGKLREVAPPAGLREAILAGGGVSGRRDGRWAGWQRPIAAWGAAAALTMLLTLGWLGLRTRTAATLEGPEALLQVARADLQPAFYNTSGTLPELGEVRRWLESPDTRLSQGLPFATAELKRAGCRVIKVGRCEVFQVCFDRGQRYHVYIAPRERFPGIRPEDLPILRQQGEVGMATWADAHYVYVLASSAGLDAVRSLL